MHGGDAALALHVILQLLLADVLRPGAVHVAPAHQVRHHRVLTLPVRPVVEKFLCFFFNAHHIHIPPMDAILFPGRLRPGKRSASIGRRL